MGPTAMTVELMQKLQQNPRKVKMRLRGRIKELPDDLMEKGALQNEHVNKLREEPATSRPMLWRPDRSIYDGNGQLRKPDRPIAMNPPMRGRNR